MQQLLNNAPADTEALPPRYTKLEKAREKIEYVDQEIARILGDFKKAANPEKKPDTICLSKVSLPASVEKLSIDLQTPRELFAGVRQFLALKIIDGNVLLATNNRPVTDRFDHLCKTLSERHAASRLVVEHKTQFAEQFKDTSGRVITFIPEQHREVVNRMHEFCTKAGSDRDLGAPILNWVASVNAGWQDMAINENTGPFVEKITPQSRFELRYPS